MPVSRAFDLPSWTGRPDDARRTRGQIESWALNPALAELVARFGAVLPSMSARETLGWLDEFSATHWDFRGGRERNLTDRLPADPALDALVTRLAPALGLANRGAPQSGRYDTVVMTGGMVRAGIVKPRFVVSLLARGISVDRIVFLGAFRSFAGDERALARALGVPGGDEFDGMVEGMRQAFGPLGEPSVEVGGRSPAAATPGSVDRHRNASWREWSWEGRSDAASAPTLTVLAAPSADPATRRANTADTLRFWASERRLPGERNVLVVTTPVYVPYQAAVAVETLGVEFGLSVETIGVDSIAQDLGEHTQHFTATHHLQELRSAIRGMRSLLAKLDG